MLPAPVLDSEQQHRDHAGDDPADQQRQIEQQVQGDRPADDLGQVGGDRDHLGLHPEGQPGGARGSVADRLGQRASGDQPEFGRQVLHQSRHHVGHHDDPHQQVAVLRPGADVGGDVAGVDVGDRGDEGRSEQVPARPERGLSVPRQLH